MICLVCKRRWADFPGKDFDISEKGIIPKNEDATKRREEAFNSDETKYCGCNNEWLEALL
jgi:hypothetical protein